MEKLKSRKFWAGIVGTVIVAVLTQAFDVQPEVAIAIVSPLIVWIFGESYVDSKNVSNR